MRKKCPFCGAEYYQPPALSRLDNMTEICTDCGLREGLTAAGLTDRVINEIIAEINNHGQEDAIDEEY